MTHEGSATACTTLASEEEKQPLYFTAVEGAAVVVTLVCVWLMAKENILGWPIGIVGCVLYIYIFHAARLYSDVLLQLFFLVTQIYGWYAWGSGSGGELAITRLTPLAALAWGVLAVAGIAGLGTFMKRRTRAALPYWDAVTTVLSVIAQIFLTRKIFESWILWVTVDFVAIGVYYARKLYMTCLLYAVLLVMAAMGLLGWLAEL